MARVFTSQLHRYRGNRLLTVMLALLMLFAQAVPTMAMPMGGTAAADSADHCRQGMFEQDQQQVPAPSCCQNGADHCPMHCLTALPSAVQLSLSHVPAERITPFVLPTFVQRTPQPPLRPPRA